MADELNLKRIIELQQKTEPAEGDCLAVDNASSGTSRIMVQNLLDPTFSSDMKAAPAAATKKKIDEVMDVFAAGVKEAVDEWLDQHPEATTTVQDGAITEAKLADALKLKTIKDYATPEMYGAKGDGITDDTDAINAALENHEVVLLGAKTYLTTKPVYVPSYTTLIGLDRHKSKIYNIGTGYLKNAVIAGHIGGDSGSSGILTTSAVTFTKTGEKTFSCDRVLNVHDLVHFKVLASNNGESRKISTSTYIVSKTEYTYVTRDPIPDNAELHLYADVPSGEFNGIKNYTTFGARVQNLTIEHLPTGSGMYCLFICGAKFVAKDIDIIGNTGLASNLSIHGLWKNIDIVSYGDNLDCAEYVYYTQYKNINITKSAIDAHTMHTQLAFGRGHDNRVKKFTSNIENQIALDYTNQFVMEDSEFITDQMSGLENDISFKNCKIHSTNAINLLNNRYIDCYIEKPVLDTINTAYFENTVTDYENIANAGKAQIHLKGYEKKEFFKLGSYSEYDVPIFDHTFMVVVQGSNLSLTNGPSTVTATSSLAIYITPSNLIRLKKDGGAIYSPAWTSTGEYKFSGSITAIEQKSLVRKTINTT